MSCANILNVPIIYLYASNNIPLRRYLRYFNISIIIWMVNVYNTPFFGTDEIRTQNQVQSKEADM